MAWGRPFKSICCWSLTLRGHDERGAADGARSYIKAWGCGTVPSMRLGAGRSTDAGQSRFWPFEQEPSGTQIARVKRDSETPFRDLYAGQCMALGPDRFTLCWWIFLALNMVLLADASFCSGFACHVARCELAAQCLSLGVARVALYTDRPWMISPLQPLFLKVLGTMPLVKGWRLKGLMLRRYANVLLRSIG